MGKICLIRPVIIHKPSLGYAWDTRCPCFLIWKLIVALNCCFLDKNDVWIYSAETKKKKNNDIFLTLWDFPCSNSRLRFTFSWNCVLPEHIYHIQLKLCTSWTIISHSAETVYFLNNYITFSWNCVLPEQLYHIQLKLCTSWTIKLHSAETVYFLNNYIV